MKVLKYSEIYLTFLGICSNRLNENTNEFLKTFNSYFFLVGFIGPLYGCSAAYIYENFSDLTTVTNALIVLSAGVASVGSFVSVGLNMKNVKLLHNKLQKIVDDSKTKQLHFLKIILN